MSSYLNLLQLDEKYKSEEMRVVSSLSGSNRAKKSLNPNVNLTQNQTQSLDQNQNQSLDQIKNQEENQALRDKNKFQEILLTPSGINLLWGTTRRGAISVFHLHFLEIKERKVYRAKKVASCRILI